MRTLGLAVALLALVAPSPSTQSPNCAPRERRLLALQVARRINSAEAAAFSQSGQYWPLPDLQISPAPSDYSVQLSTDRTTYSFSIKDTLDACHGVMFSDQVGLIYIGAPVQ